MWSVEHSAYTAGHASEVWQRYHDVAHWPQWNGAVQSVVLDGDFATGAEGRLTPPGQDPLPFRVVSATPHEGYVSETDIAETVTMRTVARLLPLAGGGTRITHRIELDGPGAPFFARSFGSVFATGMRRSLAALADLAGDGVDRPAGRALLVLTSTSVVPGNGRATGAYASEVAEAWQVFTGAGYRVELASTLGGQPPLEAVDDHDPVQRAFLADVRMAQLLADTPTFADIDADRYAVVFLVGGHGAMFDLPEDKHLARLLSDVDAGGGVLASVCHGAAGLLGATRADGEYLVAGRRLTGFSNDEERAVGMTSVVPYLLADALVARGARYESAPAFMPRVVVDGRLVTGQNPASATAVAEAALSVVHASSDVPALSGHSRPSA